jgi:uncharacterized membrane protein (DUF106 family)
MNNDEHYKEKLLQLTNKVNDITSVTQKSFIPTNIKPIYVYIAVPIILFFVLLLSKPEIIMTNVKDNNTFFNENKISYVKLSFVLLFVIVLEVVIYFITNVKRNS